MPSSKCCPVMLCLVIGAGLLCQAPAHSQQPRTWKDTTGKFSIDAVLSAQDENSVSLKTNDGRLLKVPKSKLSKADLDYLQTLPAAGEKPSAVAAEQMLTAALNGKPIAGKTQDTLPDFLSRIGTPFFVDRSSMQEIGLTQNGSVNTDMQAPSLGEQLDAILTPLNLVWYRLRTVLIVTTEEASEEKAMETLAYRIPISRNDVSAVMTRLQTVEPSSWESLGGSGSIIALPVAIMIRQTQPIHRQLARQLKIRPLTHRYVHPLDNQVVSIQIPRGNWEGFAEQLGGQLERNITLAESVSAGGSLQLELANVTAADVLEILSSHAGIQWLENPQGLELVSSQYAEQQLEQRRVTFPFASPQMASLFVNATMQLVSPESWAPLGGPGNIQHAGGKTFQLSQTQPVFRELGQLVADLSVLR